jgi:hypothetical protein
MDSHLRAIEELTAILDSGIHYSIERVDTKFLVRLGEPEDGPIVAAMVDDFEQAASWLRQQVKIRYPHSAYVKRLPTD